MLADRSSSEGGEESLPTVAFAKVGRSELSALDFAKMVGSRLLNASENNQNKAGCRLYLRGFSIVSSACFIPSPYAYPRKPPFLPITR